MNGAGGRGYFESRSRKRTDQTAPFGGMWWCSAPAAAVNAFVKPHSSSRSYARRCSRKLKSTPPWSGHSQRLGKSLSSILQRRMEETHGSRQQGDPSGEPRPRSRIAAHAARRRWGKPLGRDHRILEGERREGTGKKRIG